MWIHLKCLRKMQNDRGWIKLLLDEAENERMHLMTFIEVAKPTSLERFIIMAAQFIFIIMYSIIYLVSQRTAHRIVGYFEEEAVRSYTDYLAMVENGEVENVPAPELAIKYYKMKKNAKLSDLIKCVRADEEHHSVVNHRYEDGE